MARSLILAAAAAVALAGQAYAHDDIECGVARQMLAWLGDKPRQGKDGAIEQAIFRGPDARAR